MDKVSPTRLFSVFVKRRKGRAFGWFPVCPEELGQLGTPRPAAELCDGDGQRVWEGDARVVRVCDGADLTSRPRSGAERALQAAPHAKFAILKARSPSCGVRQTSIDGRFQTGMGVFAALLRRWYPRFIRRRMVASAWVEPNTESQGTIEIKHSIWNQTHDGHQFQKQVHWGVPEGQVHATGNPGAHGWTIAPAIA